MRLRVVGVVPALLLLVLVSGGLVFSRGLGGLPGELTFLGSDQVTILQGGKRTVHHLPPGLQRPVLSPDGTQVAGVLQGRVVLLPLGGQEVTHLGEAPAEARLSWSPDGSRLAAYGTDAVTLLGIDRPSSLVVPVERATTVAWSPRGDRLTVESGPELISERVLWDLNPVTGELKLLAQGASGPAWSPDGRSLIFNQYAAPAEAAALLWREGGEVVPLLDRTTMAAGSPDLAALFKGNRLLLYSLQWSPAGDRVVALAKAGGSEPRFVAISLKPDGSEPRYWLLPVHLDAQPTSPRVFPYTPCSQGPMAWIQGGRRLVTLLSGPGCEQKLALLDATSLAAQGEIDGKVHGLLMPSPDGEWVALTSPGRHTLIPLSNPEQAIQLEIPGELAAWRVSP